MNCKNVFSLREIKLKKCLFRKLGRVLFKIVALETLVILSTHFDISIFVSCRFICTLVAVSAVDLAIRHSLCLITSSSSSSLCLDGRLCICSISSSLLVTVMEIVTPSVVMGFVFTSSKGSNKKIIIKFCLYLCLIWSGC